MKQTLVEWLLLPFVLWMIFQPILYYNASQLEEAMNLAIYEGSKDAALEGRFTPEIYDKMKQYLVDNFHLDPTKIEITGTETLTLRGNYLEVQIKVPKPRLWVIPAFHFGQNDPANNYLVMKKYIMSEKIN